MLFQHDQKQLLNSIIAMNKFNQMLTHKLVVYPWSKGQRKVGTEEGAIWMQQEIMEINPQIQVVDIKIMESNSLIDINMKQNMRLLCQSIEKLNCNLLIAGGDHSEAIGTVLGIINMPKNQKKKIGVIWIDAHADINTYAASKTKNYHGMPLAFITGNEKRFEWTHDKAKLKTEDLIYWGIRDLDPFEQEVIDEYNIHFVRSEEPYSGLLQWIDQRQYEVLHVSLDIDSLDPEYVKSTGTVAPKGIKLEQLCNFLKEFRAKCDSRGIEYSIQLVEYNPLIGTELQRRKTEQSLKELIRNLKL